MARPTVSSPDLPPVDGILSATHHFSVSKKPHKTKEPKTAAANSPAPIQAPPAEFKPRHIDEASAKKHMEKIFRVHGDVLRRLAEYDRNG